VVVDAARHHGDERRVDVVLLQQVQAAELQGKEMSALEHLVRVTLEGVEGKGHACSQFAQAADERLLPGQADAVRADGDPVDSRRLSQLDEVQEARVDGRLPAGQVHDVQGTAVRGGEVIEHAAEIVQVHVERAVVAVVDVADRAVEVAGAGDGDHGQADLLGVARAGSAVERASVLDGTRGGRRVAARRERPRALVPRRVGAQPDLLLAVLRTRLAHPYFTVGERDHLGGHRVLADAAEAGGLVDQTFGKSSLHSGSLGRGV
jgi:hypothetical protein